MVRAESAHFRWALRQAGSGLAQRRRSNLPAIRSIQLLQIACWHGFFYSPTVQVHEVPANRAASRSVLMVRKAGDGRSVEAVYVKALNTTLYLDSSLNGSHVGMDRPPIS